VKEELVFVPVGGSAHIASVVAMPDNAPRAVVVITTGGGGVPRSHKYRLWTKLARRLAEHDIASVRMEWPGVGDSTGPLRLSLFSPPVDELTEVARFAMAAMGTTRLGLVGNCLGARSALQVAVSRLPCESVALMLLKPVHRRSRPTHAKGPSRGRLRWIRRKLPRRLKDLGRPILRRLTGAERRGRSVMQTVARLPETTDTLLLEPRIHQSAKMAALVASAGHGGDRHRFELRDLPGVAMQDFDSSEKQEALLTTLVDWFVESFAEPETLRLSSSGRGEEAAQARTSATSARPLP
jgi:alpha-beta hydrolase superfamily lysophospholipase